VTGPSGQAYHARAIEAIRTGQRVLARNPQLAEAALPDVPFDPASWVNIHLRRSQATGDPLEITLLRPVEWLAAQLAETAALDAEYPQALDGASSARSALEMTDIRSVILSDEVLPQAPGGIAALGANRTQTTSWIFLMLHELAAVGPAEVVRVEPCPPIEPDAGRLVTGTFSHHSGEVLDIAVDGLSEPIGCTGAHPFWSADRQDIIPARDLALGETLRTESGTLRQIIRITPRRGPPVAVFNLEVDVEHVYYVSTAGVLVHNTYPGNAPKSIHVGDAGHHVPAVRKSRGRPFEVERSDLSRPTIHVIGDEGAVGQAHWRMHNAERTHIGPRQGDFVGTDAELFEAYRKSYRDLHDIRVDVRSPDGSTILGRNVTLEEAVNLLETFLGGKK
jgi:hypothetical protein